MSATAKTMLDHFVDRTNELDAFRDLLSESPIKILAIKGSGGMGKTHLIDRLLAEIEPDHYVAIRVEWQDELRFDYLALMRRIRDQTGKPHLFKVFNDRVNKYTAPAYQPIFNFSVGELRNIKIAANGQIEGSNININVGPKIKIQDLNNSGCRPDLVVSDAEVEVGLTQAFIPCLRVASEAKPIVLFLDALEKADGLTRKWIWNRLLRELRDGRLPRVRAVLSGRENCEEPADYYNCLDVFELNELKLQHIAEYVRKRGLEDSKAVALVILGNFGGTPLHVATATTNTLRTMRKRDHSRGT